MTLHLHRATRADRLAAGLGELLGAPLQDPFRTEIVAVPTPGVERWLAQQLATRLGRTASGDPPSATVDGQEPCDDRPDPADGVCAGIDFWTPHRLTGQALASATGVDSWSDPWQPRRLVWPLLTVFDELGDSDWAGPLSRYLTDPSRRFSTARRVAHLFAGYAADRPTMIMRWAAGEDTDDAGAPLPAGTGWQPHLWRMLRDRIQVASPAERLESGCRALHDDPDSADLPERVSLFGPTRLDYATLAVLSALAAHRAIHLWLPHPSPTLWSELEAHPGPTRTRTGDGVLPPPPSRRADDPTATRGAHRLLSYLGRDSRELQLSLASLPATIRDHALDPPATTEPGRAGPRSSPCLLTRLRADLAADRSLPEEDRLRLDTSDRSIQVHASHDVDRQVEVLREVLLGLLADDPTLEPRDILVMCPDVETFAPVISASFGARPEDSAAPLDPPGADAQEDDARADPGTDGHPGHRLRVRLADRSLRQINPMLQLLSRLFDLADSRLEASTVLDLCSFEPVAAKFDFTADDLIRLRDLVDRSGVRWGYDASDRTRFGLTGYPQNTWAAGMDRLLLGVAMDEDGEQFLGTTLPLDDVDAGDVDLVGRLAEAVQRIRTVIEQFSRRQSLQAWVDACRGAFDLLTATHDANRGQTAQAYGELARIAETADSDTVGLTRTEASAVLRDVFAGRPSRSSFRTGTLTVAAMHPMRSVPHRVVCLLGLDDGIFPRRDGVDGDDLLAADPRVGDRDRRSEDRQLLLDAIMAAGEHLVVVYSGADPRTNAPRPPSVPVSELLDTCDLTAETADGSPAREQILRRHPLQPFDPQNFAAAPDPDARPFSFDPDALAGARATRGGRTDPEPVYSRRPLPPAELGSVIQLTDLMRFFAHPPRTYLRARAGVSLDDDEEDTGTDQIPVELDGLQKWQIGDRMLGLHLDGLDLTQIVGAEWRRGNLPPRELGRRTLDSIAGEVAQLTEHGSPLRSGHPSTVDVAAPVAAADGEPDRLVVGTVGNVFGAHAVTVHYSRLAAKHRLQSWIQLVALTATDPQPWQVTVIGRGRGREQARRSTLGPLDPKIAGLVLADLVDLYRIGLAQPLPLPPKVSAQYAQLRSQNRTPETYKKLLVDLWEDDRDPSYEAFLGRGATYAQLLSDPSVPDEERGRLGEPSRFGSLARRVWQPLLQAEVQP